MAVSEKLKEQLAKANEPETELEDSAELEPETELEAAPETTATLEDDDALDIDALRKSLDAEDDRHEHELHAILGEAFEELAPCPLCLAHGFVPLNPEGEMEPEQMLAVLATIGAIPEGMKPHPDFVRCDLCEGVGKLATGARNDDANNYVACPKCISRGYVNPKEIEAQAQAQRDATAYQVAIPAPIGTSGVPNGSPAAGLVGSPDQQPWYDHVTGQWRLP